MAGHRMPPLLSWAIFLLLTACGSAHAQRSERAEAACQTNPSHADIRECLIAERRKSDWALRDAEAAAMARANRAADTHADRQRATREFVKAARQFVQYREAQCRWQAAVAFGGNAATDRQLLCAIELNDRRAAQLRQAAELLR
jgi:uncharacterized protein YecT (DUF1311 family)